MVQGVSRDHFIFMYGHTNSTRMYRSWLCVEVTMGQFPVIFLTR